MFVLLIFCGQQGYMVYKDYKKVTNRLSDSKRNAKKSHEENQFVLFTPAVMPAKQPAAVKKPLSAEIEGILSSDEAWLSFAVIKTPAGQKSYREGEMLAGFDDAYIAGNSS
jgi:general secretion pathway protein C